MPRDDFKEMVEAYADFVEICMYRANPTDFDACHWAMGLCGELGELSEAINRLQFNKDGAGEDDVKLEAGDVIWHVFAVAVFADIDVLLLFESQLKGVTLQSCFEASARITEEVKHQVFFKMPMRKDRVLADLRLITAAIGEGKLIAYPRACCSLEIGELITNNIDKIVRKATGHG